MSFLVTVFALVALYGWLVSEVSITQSIWLLLNLYDTFKVLAVILRRKRSDTRPFHTYFKKIISCWTVYVLGQYALRLLDAFLFWLPLYSTIKSIMVILFLCIRSPMSTHLHQALFVPLAASYEGPIDTFLNFVTSLVDFISHHTITIPLSIVASKVHAIPLHLPPDAMDGLMNDLSLPGSITRPATPPNNDKGDINESYDTPSPLSSPVIIRRTRKSQPSAPPIPSFEAATNLTPGKKRKIAPTSRKAVIEDSRPDPLYTPIAQRPTDPSLSRPLTRKRRKIESNVITDSNPVSSSKKRGREIEHEGVDDSEHRAHKKCTLTVASPATDSHLVSNDKVGTRSRKRKGDGVDVLPAGSSSDRPALLDRPFNLIPWTGPSTSLTSSEVLYPAGWLGQSPLALISPPIAPAPTASIACITSTNDYPLQPYTFQSLSAEPRSCRAPTCVAPSRFITVPRLKPDLDVKTVSTIMKEYYEAQRMVILSATRLYRREARRKSRSEFKKYLKESWDKETFEGEMMMNLEERDRALEIRYLHDLDQARKEGKTLPEKNSWKRKLEPSGRGGQVGIGEVVNKPKKEKWGINRAPRKLQTILEEDE